MSSRALILPTGPMKRAHDRPALSAEQGGHLGPPSSSARCRRHTGPRQLGLAPTFLHVSRRTTTAFHWRSS